MQINFYDATVTINSNHNEVQTDECAECLNCSCKNSESSTDVDLMDDEDEESTDEESTIETDNLTSDEASAIIESIDSQEGDIVLQSYKSGFTVSGFSSDYTAHTLSIMMNGLKLYSVDRNQNVVLELSVDDATVLKDELMRLLKKNKN